MWRIRRLLAAGLQKSGLFRTFSPLSPQTMDFSPVYAIFAAILVGLAAYRIKLYRIYGRTTQRGTQPDQIHHQYATDYEGHEDGQRSEIAPGSGSYYPDAPYAQKLQELLSNIVSNS